MTTWADILTGSEEIADPALRQWYLDSSANQMGLYDQQSDAYSWLNPSGGALDFSTDYGDYLSALGETGFDPTALTQSWGNFNDWVQSDDGAVEGFNDWLSPAISEQLGTAAPTTAAKDNILTKLAATFGVSKTDLPALLSGASNSELGLGAVGILGALSALTSEPSTTSGTTSQTGTTGQTTSGTTSQDTTQTQTGTQTGSTSGTSAQTQTGTQTGSTSGTSAQTQTGTQTGATSGTTSQTQSGTTLQQQLQNVLQQMSQATSQEQTGNTTQQQTGTTAQRSAQVLPEWYLNMVRGQAEGLGDLAPMDAFGKTMLDMPIDQYMNPYLEGVLDPMMRRLSEDQARQQQDFAAQRVARGGYGTARADLNEQQMLERQQVEQQNVLTQAYEKAFGNAQGMAGTDLTRMFQEWQTMQQDPRALAQMQASTLMSLNPGAVTETTGSTTSLSDMLNRMLTAGSTTGTTNTGTTGTTTGSTTGSTLGSTTGLTSGTTTGSTLGSTTGLTSGTTTGSTLGSTTGLTSGTTTGTSTGSTDGTTSGTTTGTTGTTGTTSYTGTDPNRLGQLAGLGGTIWGLANS